MGDRFDGRAKAQVIRSILPPIQSNKAKKLVTGVPGLRVVESVHSSKLATVLNKAVDGMGRDPLRTCETLVTTIRYPDGSAPDFTIPAVDVTEGVLPKGSTWVRARV